MFQLLQIQMTSKGKRCQGQRSRSQNGLACSEAYQVNKINVTELKPLNLVHAIMPSHGSIHITQAKVIKTSN